MNIQKSVVSSLVATALIVACGLLASRDAEARLIVLPGHQAVYDTNLGVAWLRDANLALTSRFGVEGISPDGSMNYATAVQWVAALNAYNGGAGWLGINNWTLPSTPFFDPMCTYPKKPDGNSFGFNCRTSDLGSLYYTALGLQYPNTAVPIPEDTVGPFRNFQPYLYWSATISPDNGYSSFSFNTGYTGANVDMHYMYVLPMIKHKVRRSGITYHAGFNQLQVSSDGTMVYDPGADVTWLADADLAATEHFGAQCTLDGIQCINPDGSMSHTTAEAWIQGMNVAAYLGQTNWELPPTEAMDTSCKSGFDCTGSPMGELFYSELGLTRGTAVFGKGNGGGVVSFEHVQPYLYWSCSAPDPCEENQPPEQNFEWSFSFGNGFQGTDLDQNYLYVIPYSKATAESVMVRELSAAPVSDTERNLLLSRIGAITATSNQIEKSAALAALIDELSAQCGKTFTSEDASALIGLAQAVAEQTK